MPKTDPFSTEAHTVTFSETPATDTTRMRDSAYVPSAFQRGRPARKRPASPERPQPDTGADMVLFPGEPWDAEYWDLTARRKRKRSARGLGAVVVFALIAAGAFAYVQRFELGLVTDPRAPEVQESAAAVVGTQVGDRAPVASESTVSSDPSSAPPRPVPPGDGAPARMPSASAAGPGWAGTPAEPRSAEPTPVRSAPPVASRPSAPEPMSPGSLSIQAYPWGSVYIDGEFVGNTPLVELSVPAGTHIVRVERPGFETHVRAIAVLEGQSVRLTGIRLNGIGR